MKMTFYILSIFLTACRQHAGQDFYNEEKSWPTPFVLDSLPTADKGYQTSEMSSPFNDVEYVGLFSDTVNITIFDTLSDGVFRDFQDLSDSLVEKNGFKILVSMSQLLTIDLENYAIPPPPPLIENDEGFYFDSIEKEIIYDKWNARPRNYIQAIPVFIVNPTKDTLFLYQQDGSVFMIQEAKNEDGEWKPIEYWRYSWCGNSYGATGILPNNFAFIKVFKYVGDFETEIRLKLKSGNTTIYSDSFKGSINKSQFELPANVMEKFLSRGADGQEYLDGIFFNR